MKFAFIEATLAILAIGASAYFNGIGAGTLALAAAVGGYCCGRIHEAETAR